MLMAGPAAPSTQPKMQSHLECRLWNDIFVDAQRQLDIPVGELEVSEVSV